MKKIILWILIAVVMVISIVACLLNYNLETSYVVLQDKTGKQLHFLGVMHCGTKNYFNQLQTILNNFQGVILFEGIQDGDGLEPVLKSYKLMADLLNIEFQGKAIDYQSDWVLSDITMKELAASINMQEITNQDKLLEKWIQNKNRLSNSQLKISLCLYKDLIEIVSLFTIMCPYDPLITIRNAKPIQDAKYFLASKYNVLIFYGDAHSNGIIKHFKKHGFREISKKRFKVF